MIREIAHVVRYTSPTSRSELRDIIIDSAGYYSYWDTGCRATLRELLINEGLAVHASRVISPGHAAWEYYGYERRQYADVRQLETVMARLRYWGTIDLKGKVDARMETELLRNTWVLGPVLSLALWPVSKTFEYQITGTVHEPKSEPVFIPKILFFHPLLIFLYIYMYYIS